MATDIEASPQTTTGGILFSRLKAALAILLVLAVIVVLAPPPKSERRYPNRIRVTLWHAFSGEWQPIYEGMVQRFNESQTKYEVVPVSLPGESLTTKFLLSTAGGETPDIILDWDPILGMWTDMGLIRSFDGIMTQGERKKFLAETYPIVKLNATYRGKIMAMIDGLDFWAIYYRLDDLKEIGLDARHLPKTLEDLVRVGKKLDRYEHGQLRRVGFIPSEVTKYIPAFGGAYNKDGQIVVDTPENVRAMQFIGDNAKRLGYDAITRFTSSLAADEGPNMPLIAGNYSIRNDGEWRVKQVAQYKPDLPYVVAPMPPPQGGKANSSMTAPNYLVIPTAAKQPQGAWEFAKYCVGFLHPEEGGRHMGEMGWIPDDPSVARSKSYQAYLKKYPQYKVFVGLMTSPNLGIFPQGPLEKFVMDEIGKADEAVNRGAQSPAAAMALVQQHLNEERRRRQQLGEPVGNGPQ